MNCNTTHYRANSSSVPGDPTLVTADGFAALRALLGERARAAAATPPWRRAPRHDYSPAPGRFSLFLLGADLPPEEVREAWARQLLRRYGVVFRDLVQRDAALPWRELSAVYRRLEARGEIRGGRFVAGFVGEQFALPEVVDSLRALRRESQAGVSPGGEAVVLAATDPLNLVGTITPGPRVPAVSGNRILLRDGVPVATLEAGAVIARASGVDAEAVAPLLNAPPPRPRSAAPNPQDWL